MSARGDRDPEPAEFLRRVIESLAEGVWAMDREGKIVYANEAMSRMLGLPRERVLGRPAGDFLDEDGRARLVAALARRREGVCESQVTRLKLPGGGALACEFICASAGGGAEGWKGSLRW